MGFNEAACKEAEKHVMVTPYGTPSHLASMRPPAKRRKNVRLCGSCQAHGRSFNEAACKEAEKPP